MVRLPLDELLELVVLVPDLTLPTKSARQALPGQDRAGSDAIFNLGRMGMLLAGLADHRFLSKEATEDRLHQGYRTPLFPEAPALLADLQSSGALASCWSGAGPSLLAMCAPGTAEAVRKAGERWSVAASAATPSRSALTTGAWWWARTLATAPRRRSERAAAQGPSPRLTAVTRKFLIRTFGCQMNEHDSERLAGLLVADGLEPTEELDEADVMVLNTCCIRENADNKLYGHLGHLASLKRARPELQIAVAGCLSQKDRGLIQERAGHVDVVFGTHNLARAPVCCAGRASEGPIVEILDAPDPEAAWTWCRRSTPCARSPGRRG